MKTRTVNRQQIAESHTFSFWQRAVGLPRQQNFSAETNVLETDLCIVGGGIVGSSVAYLARRQGRDVLLLEARQPALGASGRNAGMVLTGIADNYAAAVRTYGRETARRLWQLSIENREAMLTLATDLGVPFDRCGSWLLADCEQEAEELAEADRLLDEDGFPHEFVASDPLERGFLAGLYRPRDAVINPAQLTDALHRAAQVRVISGSPVRALTGTAGGRVRVESARAIVLADRVLLCTNAYSVLLHPYFEGKVIPCRGQIQVSEPTPMIFRQAGYSHFGYWYFRQIPEPDDPSRGRWLIGGGRHLHRASEDGTFDDGVTDAVQSDLRAYTARYFPELADVPVAHRWAGTMGFTADGLPIVGRLPDLPNVVFCVGFNGHGMGLGVKVVERALGLLIEGRDPGIFGVGRLGETKTRMATDDHR